MGNKIVRRLTAAILTGVMLFTYTACNKASVPDATSSSERKSHDSQKTAEYIVDNEDKAQKVLAPIRFAPSIYYKLRKPEE